MQLSPRSRRKISSALFESLDFRRLLAAAEIGLDHEDLHSHDDHTITYFPETVVLRSESGFLTGSQSGRRADMARKFAADYATQFGLLPGDVRGAIITDQYTDTPTGVTHVYMQQTLNGLPIQNTSLGIHFAGNGRVISASSSFVRNLDQQAEARPSPSAMVHPWLALRSVTNALEMDFPAQPPRLEFTGGEQLIYSADSAAISLDPIDIRAHYIAVETGVQLAWKFVVRPPDGSNDWFDISVDARTGDVIFLNNWNSHLASYNVFPAPLESPTDGGRQVVIDPHDLTASPFGWHDTNGAAGPEFTDTRGNNVSAQDDADGNNSGGTRPDGGAGLNFDAPLDFSLQPIGYRNAATLNLFYWNNILHDVLYQYGFNEASGNFQNNTYGRGGTGNDAVQADAQDEADLPATSINRNNANFATPPDGSPGRMQMYIFTGTNPNRDGDFDAGIIAHEYGHGVSNRLTGGPANANALSSTQSRGMGEGWSDFYSLMFTQVAADQPNDAYPVGTYALGQPSTGPGIRRRPYSFDKNINPLTFEAFGTSGTTSYGVTRSTQVHNSGELWASALWDLNWLLVAKNGFDANLHSGYDANGSPAQRAGNKLTMRLVMDGMKLQPANPSFTQARDAILSADVALTGGANAREIWLAFARRGLGVNAATAGATSTAITTSFDVPAALFDPIISSSTPSGGTLLSPLTSFSFVFSEPVNPASFSVADDVQSFTGPGGVNLLGSITGFGFSNGDQTLTINYIAPAAVGSYAMTIGPNITAIDNGAAMDQNINGTPGEAADAFSTSYTYQRFIGPDSAGYLAGEYPYQAIDLVIGQPGVVTLVNGTDDGNALLTLPAGSTFNFYGTEFSSLSVSANGLISFGGTVTTSAGNGNFTTAPVLASIGALYDDWVTNTNTAGDSAVLYRIDATTNRLIIEWSDVPHFSFNGAGSTPATFQTILQLNTEGVPGRIINNYVDLDVGSPTYNNGASATTAIKDAGTQGTRRLLLNQNSDGNAWVQSGRANVFALDVTPPTVEAGAFSVDDAALAVTFDENVSASVTTSAFAVQNLTTGLPLAVSATGYESGTDTASASLPISLDDGNYRLTVSGALDGSGIADATGNALDGDQSGLAGGDFSYDFFFLRGDANGDRAVNLDDFTALAANFGLSGRLFSQGDFNYSTNVDLNDFTILAAKFGTTLAPAGLPNRPAAGPSVATGSRQAGGIATETPSRLVVKSVFANDRLVEDVLSDRRADQIL